MLFPSTAPVALAVVVEITIIASAVDVSVDELVETVKSAFIVQSPAVNAMEPKFLYVAVVVKFV